MLIVACDRASMLLAEKKEEIFEKIDEEPSKINDFHINIYMYCLNKIFLK